MKVYKGKVNVESMRLAIVVARFNEFITKSLLEGALDAAERYSINERAITVAWVPGAFEVPLVAKRLALSGNYDAVICLGAIIRGATPHFDFVAAQAAAGVSQAALDSGLPVIFGILTTDTIEQALERAGTKCGNKGFDAVVTAIEMTSLMQILDNEEQKDD